jgi:hypothetical protein
MSAANHSINSLIWGYISTYIVESSHFAAMCLINHSVMIAIYRHIQAMHIGEQLFCCDIMTQDVGGLNVLRWPSGTIIIQWWWLSVGQLSCIPATKNEYSLENIEYILKCMHIQYKAGRRKFGSSLLATTRQNASANSSHLVLIQFLSNITV